MGVKTFKLTIEVPEDLFYWLQTQHSYYQLLHEFDLERPERGLEQTVVHCLQEHMEDVKSITGEDSE